MGQPRILSKRRAFLASVALCGSITEAAAACGLDRSWHYRALKSDPDYPALFAAALATGEDALEDEATFRAMRGVFEPLTYKGQFCYEQIARHAETVDPETGETTTVTTFERGAMLGTWVKSDALLMFRLKAAKPDKYRERGSMELTGKNGSAIENVMRVEFVRP